MIVRPPEHWLRALFVWEGSVLPAILPQLLLVLAVSLAALATDGRVLGRKIPLDTAPFPMVGASLAIFLAFRNSASYERYVEARRIWGRILGASRTLVSQALCAGVEPAPLAAQVTAFVQALRHQLRGSDPRADLARRLAPELLAQALRQEFRPVFLLHRLRSMLGALPAERGWMLDRQLCILAEAVGACERIANTPIPYPYGVLLHRTVYAYCFLLPFGLVDTIGAATPLISVLLAYTLFALDAIAAQVAEPFGTAPNALALDALACGIERSVLELCGQPLPAAVEAGSGYVLT